MYDQIAANKRDSVLLLAGVMLLLLGIGYVFARAERIPPEFGLIVAAGVGVVAWLMAIFGGSSMVLAASNARQVTHDTSPQLFNVVEEMALASGLPMPKVYVIDDPAPNAFATGRNPETASLAITTGLLQKLNRDELQGVMAHEMSHVRNFDTRLMILLAVLVGGIVMAADVFWRISYFGGGRRSRDDDNGGGQMQMLFFVLAIVLAILAPIFARLLEMAVSRQREYLADASAALITRYPEGLACALEKISADPTPLQAANRATQHLYIVNPLKGAAQKAAGLFDTHPPIEDRVRRLRAMEGRPAA